MQVIGERKTCDVKYIAQCMNLGTNQIYNTMRGLISKNCVMGPGSPGSSGRARPYILTEFGLNLLRILGRL